MSDKSDILIVALLRRVDAKLDRVTDDVHDLKVRVTSLEANAATVNRRLDRIEDRLDRIERRLDAVDA